MGHPAWGMRGAGIGSLLASQVSYEGLRLTRGKDAFPSWSTGEAGTHFRFIERHFVG